MKRDRPVIQSIRKILEKRPIDASAPCRIDSGGTWDIKALALPLEKIKPVTVNIALNLRTHVILAPFGDGKVKILSKGFSHVEQYPFENLPFNSRFGLFFAAVSHFGFHGLQIQIKSDSPVKSALGGSSTALIALLKALSKAEALLGRKKLSRRELLHLGFHIEEAVSRGKCGIQDQAAAAYGGMNLWTWCYGNERSPFRRERLLVPGAWKGFSRSLLVAYSGKSHVSLRTNRTWVDDFLTGKTRSGWIKVNEIVHRTADAIKRAEWNEAARLLNAEMAIRREITPDALIPLTAKMIDQAESLGCGARFAGAGGGGSVWALGNVEKIRELRKIWKLTLDPVKNGKILDCAIDPMGVK
jgi:D-glycero-alpha-D-manno-heptose-7-phosphate kinase